MTNHTTAKVMHLPLCDFPHEGSKPSAAYDAKTRQGPWAYMCEEHFKSDGLGKLGLGLGQKLEVYTEEEADEPEEEGCEGHPDGPVMGETFYCDGTCR